jgi:hypothetical protein
METVNLDRVQYGYYNVSGDVWTPDLGFIGDTGVPGLGEYITAWIYQINTANVRDPYRYSRLALNVTGSVVAAAAPTDLVYIGVTASSSPALWTDSAGGNPPPGTTVDYSAGWTPLGGVTASLNGDIGDAILDPVTNTNSYDLADIRQYIEPTDGVLNGYIGITLRYQTAGLAVTGLGSTFEAFLQLTVERNTFWTGQAGGPWAGQRTRVGLDGRFGMPYSALELVEDGESSGVWVRPEHWDPEDPEPDYTGNPQEGVREDDVPVQ